MSYYDLSKVQVFIFVSSMKKHLTVSRKCSISKNKDHEWLSHRQNLPHHQPFAEAMLFRLLLCLFLRALLGLKPKSLSCQWLQGLPYPRKQLKVLKCKLVTQGNNKWRSLRKSHPSSAVGLFCLVLFYCNQWSVLKSPTKDYWFSALECVTSWES